MNASLLVQLCGLPLIAVLSLLSLALFAFSLFLAFRVRRESLLVAFLPVCILPPIAGLFFSLTSTMSSIRLQLDNGENLGFESGLLLEMNLVPLLASLLAACPAALVAVAGRWWLAWSASGERMLPERKKQTEPDSLSDDAWVAREADDYLEKLVRPR